MINYKRIFCVLIIGMVLFYSCSSPEFKVLEPSIKNGIIMEGLYWRGTFDPNGGFELRLTNNSNANLYHSNLIFDDKYSHTLLGLHTVEKGLLKDTVVKKGEQLTFKFNHDVSNLDYYNIEEKNFFPKTVKLAYDSGSVNWNF
jgi:hypothetical protein